MIAILIAKVRVNYVLTQEGRRKSSSLPPSRNARFDEEGFFPGLVSFSKYGSDLISRVGGGGYSPIWAIRGRAAVFGLSALNRVYNFKRGCPGPVLDRVWLQDCCRVFGNPKSEALLCIYFSEQCFTSIEFPLKVHRC